MVLQKQAVLCAYSTSLSISSMTPSPLPTQQQWVSTHVCMHAPGTLCTHFSLFISSMTSSSTLPPQQQPVSTLHFMHVSIHFMYTFVSLYVLHDTFFTTTCTTTVGKYSCFYACSRHFMYTFFSLYILHDIFFNTTTTTTASKYSSFYACVHPLYVHICLSLRPP